MCLTALINSKQIPCSQFGELLKLMEQTQATLLVPKAKQLFNLLANVTSDTDKKILSLTSLLKPSNEESRLTDIFESLLSFRFPLPLDRSDFPLPDCKSSFEDLLNRELNFLDFPSVIKTM